MPSSLPINRDGSITARIAGLVNTNVWAKAGVMIRADDTPTSPHAIMLLSAASGLAFQRRLQAGQASINTGATANNRTWVRLTRVGNVFSGYASVDGSVWSLIGSVTNAMPSGALMGLAVSSHTNAAVAQADFQNVSAVE